MFKIGDKVRLVQNFDSYAWYAQGKEYTIIEQFCSSEQEELGLISKELVDSYPNDFELVQEEQPTKQQKQNWSIRVHSKEQAEVYEKTLIALGYDLTNTIQKEWCDGTKCLRHGDGSQNYFWYSFHSLGEVRGKWFDNLESFLAWHFQEEETEQQKQIKELEETIARAQQQIEQLKNGL